MTNSSPDPKTVTERGRSRRTSAAIATALTLPLTLILAFALARPANKHHQPSTAPVKLLAPPTDTSTAGPCNKVLAALPTQLDVALAPRTVKSEPASPYVLAWGDPPVVLRCGVGRPVGFVNTSLVYLVGVYWYQASNGGDDVFTAIDRAVYLEVRVPKAQVNPLDPIGKAIAQVLPAVCAVPEHVTDVVPDSQLCTHR